MQSDFTYQIDWDGDGQVDHTAVGPASGWEVAHSYATAGDYRIAVTATDKDGDTGPSAEHVLTISDEGTAFIGGYVYLDVNDNGIKEVQELALPNVPIALTTGDGEVLRTALSDAHGWYEFGDLAPGSYQVREHQPGAFLDGQDTPGEPLYGVVANDQFRDLQLPAGTVAVNYNFGERGLIPALVSKKYFLASTPDGQQLLATIAAESGEGWFTFAAGREGELMVTVDSTVQGPSVELYTGEMMPVALSQGEHLMFASVSEGEHYVLHIAGDADGEMLQASLALTPRSPGVPPEDRLLDVNADGWISPLDALLIINQLNGERKMEIQSGQIRYRLDINRDNLLSPLDALLVINYLNQRARVGGRALG